MARSARQSKILEIITKYDIETQDELNDALRAENFDVTQATVSRDVKELRLIKVKTDTNKYKYAVEKTAETGISTKLKTIFRESVISVDAASNLIVIKTLSNSAKPVGALIDKLKFDGVIGCIAGDDNVLIIAKDLNYAQVVINSVNAIIN